MQKTPETGYEAYFNQMVQSLNERERALITSVAYTPEKAAQMIDRLTGMGYMRYPGGLARMGLDKGLECLIEGNRTNETPVREIEVAPFYISKTTVTNEEFERFDKRHTRTHTAQKDRSPVTCVTYGRAISYVLWLNEQTGMNFSLPTEPQVFAATAPVGWEFPYKEAGKPERRRINVFKSFEDSYPQGEMGATLEVDDLHVEPNYLGLYQMGGNVSIFALGHYLTAGHWGATSDGAYAVAIGGNFRTCPLGSRVVTRGIADVAGAFDTIGIRLVHPDPSLFIKEA